MVGRRTGTHQHPDGTSLPVEHGEELPAGHLADSPAEEVSLDDLVAMLGDHEAETAAVPIARQDEPLQVALPQAVPTPEEVTDFRPVTDARRPGQPLAAIWHRGTRSVGTHGGGYFEPIFTVRR